jgi:hypothetical protein
MTGTQNDLARFLGVHKSSVSRAVKAGRIKPEADGSFDFDKCAAAWHSSSGGRIDVAARHAAQRGAAIPKAQPAAENAPNAEYAQSAASLGVEDGGRNKAKTLLLHYENSAIKLEMALRRGLRYERAAARREAQGLGAMLRAGIERVIDQTAPRLAAAGNDLERRRIVEREIRRLRWMWKRELPRALRRMKEQGDGKVGAGGTAT